MDFDDFFNWLKTTKNFTDRAAKDVISRCKRISKLSENVRINEINFDDFIKSETYLSQTMYIKSQLKRAYCLYKEFEASK